MVDVVKSFECAFEEAGVKLVDANFGRNCQLSPASSVDSGFLNNLKAAQTVNGDHVSVNEVQFYGDIRSLLENAMKNEVTHLGNTQSGCANKSLSQDFARVLEMVSQLCEKAGNALPCSFVDHAKDNLDEIKAGAEIECAIHASNNATLALHNYVETVAANSCDGFQSKTLNTYQTSAQLALNTCHNAGVADVELEYLQGFYGNTTSFAGMVAEVCGD